MSYYVGLDVSVKSVAICVVDGDGAIIARGDVSTDPDRIATFLSNHAPNAERVVHESGILAIWLTRELLRRGVPIICIDARLAHKALCGRSIYVAARQDCAESRPSLRVQKHLGNFPKPAIRQEMVKAGQRMTELRTVLTFVRGAFTEWRGLCAGKWLGQ